jgi:hypothetical protein
MDAANRATAIINSGSPFSTIKPELAEKIIQDYKTALDHAEIVDISFLNKSHSKWGEHFRDEFIKGIKLFIQGHNDHDIQKSLEGQRLLQAWGEWFSKNISAIRNSE